MHSIKKLDTCKIQRHRENNFRKYTAMGCSPSYKHISGTCLSTFKGLDGVKRQIILGKKIGKFGKSNVYLGNNVKTGDFLAVIKFTVYWKNLMPHSSDEQKYEKILALNNQLNLLFKLKHPNLCHYIDWQYFSTSEKLKVNILSELCEGLNLMVFTSRKDGCVLSVEVIRTYTICILEALQYLHLNMVAHRNLTVSNIFVNREGKLKLIGYSLTDKLENNLLKNSCFSLTEQREDFCDLGQLILSFLTDVTQLSNKVEIPNNISNVIKDFVHMCIDKNNFPNLTSEELLTHNFVCDKLPRPFTREIVTRKKIEEKNSKKNLGNKTFLSTCQSNQQSRFESEFELIKILGKGGFGDVFKVRNKLDGGVYAIKKIILNPKNKKINGKMMREVKLLSQLKHEHVVRYYCSWIEVCTQPANEKCSNSESLKSQANSSKNYSHVLYNSVRTKASFLSNFDLFRDVENMAPEAGDEPVEWLISFDHLEVETVGKFYNEIEEDNKSCLFQCHSSNNSDRNIGNAADNSKTKIDANGDLQGDDEMDSFESILFIQMECCDERTLRTTIDEGLYQNKDRVWRLFREILEGLCHIHEKDIIHRDLKPVNIFLDPLDHVKIGDFGLARTDLLCKNYDVQDGDGNLSEGSSGDSSLTGAIGTAYYVSPEVMSLSSRACYDQKVDMYSLGIIFFEMNYRSLLTEHERAQILSNLRLPNIILPKDFDTNDNVLQTKIIRLLLNHNPKLRPSSKEMVKSSFLPIQAKHESELSQILNSAINYPQSNTHSQMLTAIFNQKIVNQQEIMYDFASFENMITWRTALLYQQMKSVITDIFTKHGAISLPLPFFMPNINVYEDEKHLVKLMNCKGGIISVPIDQRVSFARFIGRKNVCNMKRFAIDKVFREKQSYYACSDVHPAEFTECAFDIIFPVDSLIPDSEVLIVMQEIVYKYSILQERKPYVRINHLLLLRAILLSCGISLDLHSNVLAALAQTRVKTNRVSVLEEFCAVKLTESMMSRLNSFLDIEDSLQNVTQHLLSLTSSFSKIGILAKTGLEDIKMILSFATQMGLQLQTRVCLGLIYKPKLYSGVVYQVLCDKPKKDKTDVIAVGGRYDKLIQNFMLPSHKDIANRQIHGVGISILLESLAVVVAEDEQIQRLTPYDILVCSLGHTDMTQEKLTIVSHLWADGFSAELLLEKVEDIAELINKCLFKGISHIVVIINTEPLILQVYSLHQESIVTKTMTMEELTEYIYLKRTEMLATQSEPPWLDICSMDTSWTDI